MQKHVNKTSYLEDITFFPNPIPHFYPLSLGTEWWKKSTPKKWDPP